jgi:hypothetical protein
MRLLLLNPSMPTQLEEYVALRVRDTEGTTHWAVIAEKPDPVSA